MRIACAVVMMLAFGGLSAGLMGGCASSGAKSGSESGAAMSSMGEGVQHQVSDADLAMAHSTEGVKANEVTLWVNGLGCPLCATNIDKQLETLSSVTSVKVDLGTGKVKVGLLPGKPHPSPAQFSHVVENAGFTLVKVE